MGLLAGSGNTFVAAAMSNGRARRSGRARGNGGAGPALKQESFMLYDCPECGLPAVVFPRGQLLGTDGPLDIVSVRCAAAHHFLGPADTLRVLLPMPTEVDAE
jgi:hypothetical protein